MILNKILYQLLFLGITVFVVPLVPILIIYIGTQSSTYVIHGTLNLSYENNVSAWGLYYMSIKNLLSLNLGTSTSTGLPVVHELYNGFYESFKIILPAILFSYLFGTFIGVLKRNLPIAENVMFNFLFYIPMIVYSYLLLWLSGEVGIDFTSEVKYIYAVLILSIYPIFVVMKSFVMKYKEVIVSDCYLFHLSMGFSNKSVLRKFFIKYFGMEYIAFFENIVIYMFGYVYFVEAPFAINGVGYKFIMGVQRYDYPLIIGFCIAAFILFSVINIVVEILRYKIDVRGSI